MLCLKGEKEKTKGMRLVRPCSLGTMVTLKPIRERGFMKIMCFIVWI